jgi:hypothetical protein
MKIKVNHELNEDGIPIVKIPLTNSDRLVVLYEQDFNTIIELGVTPIWKLTNNQVFARGRGRFPIARLVANAKAGETIKLIDKDPCNLKRDNLLTTGGQGKFNTRDKLTPIYKKHSFWTLEHIYNKPSWINK